MSPGRLDLPALVSGVAILGLGLLLMLDRVEALELSFGVLAPAVLAVCGAILVSTGLDGREREPDGGP